MTPATAREEITARLKELLRNQEEIRIDVDSITEDTEFDDVGFDSLSILDFMYEIEERFEVPLEVKDLLDMQKVGDLVAHLQGKLAE